MSRDVFIQHMASRARRRETHLLDVVHRHHPKFGEPPGEIRSDGITAQGQLEGGDVLVIGESSLVIGWDLLAAAVLIARTPNAALPGDL